MKIVLDCNVIISGGIKNGVCRKLIHHVLDHHTLYISEDILNEYKEIISRPKFKSAYTYLYNLIEVICELSELVEPRKINYILPDKDDIIYLEAALTAGADYIITGNIKDFPQSRYGTTNIIKPADFSNVCKIEAN